MIILLTNRLIKDDPEIRVIDDVQEVFDYFKDKEVIALDTETDGLDPHSNRVLSLQLGDKDNQYVIDLSTYPLRLFKELLEDKTKTYIIHNVQFDWQFIFNQGINIAKVYDTMLAEQIIHTGRDQDKMKYGLKHVAKRRCGVNMDKTFQKGIADLGFITGVIQYMAEDVEHLHEIRDQQLLELSAIGLLNVLELENKCIKVFARMTYTGIGIDVEKWNEVIVETGKAKLAAEASLDDVVATDNNLKKVMNVVGAQQSLFGDQLRTTAINWASAKQKKHILKAAGIFVESTDSRFLNRYKKYPIVRSLLEYNKYNKLNNAFGAKFLNNINSATGRIHARINPIMKTGRISVSNPNNNQIPSKGEMGKKIRNCFIPSKGRLVVGGDYSGMELRIIAEFSQDPLWLKIFNDGGDLHSELCAKTFDIPLEDVLKPFPGNPDKSYRDVQKTVNFGLAYGMSHRKLADTMQIPEETAQEIIEKFFSLVPKVEATLNKFGALGVKYGWIRTSPPFRRRRIFTDYIEAGKKDKKALQEFNGKIERASKNMPIQGTNGDIIKQALVDTQDYIDNNNSPVEILLSVYDEIQTECDEDFSQEWVLILEDIMIKAAEKVIKTVPIVVDCKIAQFWDK